MNRNKNHAFTIAAICCGLLVTLPSRSASQTVVSRSDWAGGVTLPSYVSMQIYIPKNLAAKPPIVVSSHACQSSVSGQIGANSKIKAMADKNGFIMIFPDNQGQNCWDVGSNKALTHDGGGDPHAVAQMVRYALKKYSGDSSRVYALGGSSGGMMTQALLAIYPEIFVAGAPRAGVPCGCWAVEYEKSGNPQWSAPCATGTVSKTAQQWGDLVRAINPKYTGHRPRVQIFQGESDQTISFNNSAESIKEWTNVLGLNTNPDSTDKISTPAAGYNYNRKFWKNKCGYTVLEAWSAPGQGHSMNYEEDAIMKFFGIDVAGGKDPELAACVTSVIGAASGTIGAHKRIFFKEKALVLNAIRADEVSVTIVNTAGQIKYTGNHKIRSNSASFSIPLSFLHSGYFILSAVFHEGNKQVNCDNIHFVVTK
jgi:poly(hydroxyalkanoate) depolymerase family esterase